jgi:hypothetical protein
MNRVLTLQKLPATVLEQDPVMNSTCTAGCDNSTQSTGCSAQSVCNCAPSDNW